MLIAKLGDLKALLDSVDQLRADDPTEHKDKILKLLQSAPCRRELSQQELLQVGEGYYFNIPGIDQMVEDESIFDDNRKKGKSEKINNSFDSLTHVVISVECKAAATRAISVTGKFMPMDNSVMLWGTLSPSLMSAPDNQSSWRIFVDKVRHTLRHEIEHMYQAEATWDSGQRPFAGYQQPNSDDNSQNSSEKFFNYLMQPVELEATIVGLRSQAKTKPLSAFIDQRAKEVFPDKSRDNLIYRMFGNIDFRPREDDIAPKPPVGKPDKQRQAYATQRVAYALALARLALVRYPQQRKNLERYINFLKTSI